MDDAHDGTQLLATTSYRDGFADPSVAIIGLDGSVLLDLQGVVTGMTWEDNDHLLVRIYDLKDERWAVLRVSRDGNREYAYGPVDGGAEVPPIVLGER